MKMAKSSLRTVFGFALALSLCGASTVWADANELGKSLTPLGAEMAGNAAGTIPAWTGGITSPPSGFTPGDHHPDPFADDSPLFTITAENAERYAEQLSPGQRAMFARYPNSFRMTVYPTRRSASYPQEIYDWTKRNAETAELTADGNGVLNASYGIPFPIPQNGLQVIWNHLLRYRGASVDRTVVQASPTASGNFTPVVIHEQVLWAYTQRPGMSIDDINNRLAYFLQTVTSPARLAGNILLVHETLNQVREPRRAWTYNPGQRRVRRAPNVAYDNPGTASDGQRTSDNLDMFNGSPDRYNWELVGKREMYVPYNSYKLHSDSLKHNDIIRAGHLNPDHLRYELHRVWVVEATLKSGTRHIYPRRTFYIDEDSWQILVVDHYDTRGNMWRVSEAHVINYYDQPLIWATAETWYDLQNGRYAVFGLNNELSQYEFNKDFSLTMFSPEALRIEGVR